MKLSIKKIYLFILSISMCISMYTFSFFDKLPIIYIIFMLFAILFIFLNMRIKNKNDYSSLILTLTFLFMYLINFLFSNITVTSNNIISIGKLLIWGLILSFSTIYLDKKKFIKYIYHVSIVATIYLFVQSIFYYMFSISLSNVFDFGIIEFRTLDMGTLTNIYRPSSFFAEPIDYSNFILVCLTFVLFDEDFKNIINKRFTIIIYIIGILLSASTTVIFMLLLIGLIYFLKSNGKKAGFRILFLLVIVPLALSVWFNFESILFKLGTFGETFYNAIYKVNYFSTSSRIGGSYSRLSSLSSFRLAFGYGIGNEYYLYDGIQQYMNTITRLIFQYGILGIFMTLIYFIRLFIKSNNAVSKILVLIVFIECFTSNILFSISSIFIFSIIYLCNKHAKGALTNYE